MSDCTCQRCTYQEDNLLDELASRPAKRHAVRYFCKCGHTAETHNIVKRHNGCDLIGCPCTTFVLGRTEER